MISSISSFPKKGQDQWAAAEAIAQDAISTDVFILIFLRNKLNTDQF